MRAGALCFVGIGGAGLSAYANIARAWGAEVARLGPRRDAVPRARSTGSRSISPASPSPPDGWEVVVSTAVPPRCDGTPRASFLAELVAAARVDRRRRRARQDDDDRDDRVRAARARPRPGMARSAAWCRSSAATPARATGWLVVEGDESDRSIVRAAAADRGRDERRARPSRDVRRPRPSSRRLFEAWLADVPRGRARLGARARRLRARRCPASTTGATRPRRSRRSSCAGVDRGGGGSRLSRGSRAPIDASSSSASAAASRSIDDYGHNPTELAGDARGAHASGPDASLVASSSRMSSRARDISRSELGEPRSALADVVDRDRRLRRRASSRWTA